MLLTASPRKSCTNNKIDSRAEVPTSTTIPRTPSLNRGWRPYGLNTRIAFSNRSDATKKPSKQSTSGRKPAGAWKPRSNAKKSIKTSPPTSRSHEASSERIGSPKTSTQPTTRAQRAPRRMRARSSSGRLPRTPTKLTKKLSRETNRYALVLNLPPLTL